MLGWVVTIFGWLLALVIVLILVGIVWLKLFMIGFARTCKSNARLSGKTIIVTGANTGIGKETALDLSKRGARVICACRNEQLGTEAVRDIKEQCGHQNVIFEKLDLADFDSIRDFARRILEREPRLDVLINNAGVAAANRRQRTKQGLELTFGVNHLGHFLLTHLLLDLLKSSAPSRIVCVASLAHNTTNLKFGLRKVNGIYRDLGGYEASKLANILHARELAKRLQGTGVTANSLHPGAIASDIWRHLDKANWLVKWIIQTIVKYMMYDCTMGAQTSIYCAVEESLETVSGKYFDNCRLGKQSKLAKDDEIAKKVWDISMELCGLQES